MKEFGIEHGAKMCQELVDAGFNGLHLYTLNLETVTYGVLDKLGLKKEVAWEPAGMDPNLPMATGNCRRIGSEIG